MAGNPKGVNATERKVWSRRLTRTRSYRRPRGTSVILEAFKRETPHDNKFPRSPFTLRPCGKKISSAAAQNAMSCSEQKPIALPIIGRAREEVRF